MRTRTSDAPGRPSVVLFDFDGVIRHWRADVTDALDRDMGLEVGTLERLAHAVPEHDLGVLGKVTFDDWCHAVTRALESVVPPGAAAGAVEQWRGYRGDIDDRMVTLIKVIRGSARVGLVSNAHDCLFTDLRVLGVDGLFDHVVCSAVVGRAKPDPAVYAAAAVAFAVEPHECVFVDDRAENVQGALKAGMHAEQFRDPSACGAFIDAALRGDTRAGPPGATPPVGW